MYCRHSPRAFCLLLCQDHGASQTGVMKREKFLTALKDNFSRCYFTQELLDEITNHYGVGYKDQRGVKESVGWKDFTEDVLRAHTMVRPGSPEAASAEQARGKGHIPGKGMLPMPVRGWQPQ